MRTQRGWQSVSPCELAVRLSPVLPVLPMVHDDALWFSLVLPALQDVVSAQDECPSSWYSMTR